MYVILTSKPGIFRTEAGVGLKPVEAWEYSLDGKLRASFVVAEIEGQPRITVIEEDPPHVVNSIPSKFMQKFETLQAARNELDHLIKFRDLDVKLLKVPVKVQADESVAAPAGMLSITFITNGDKRVTAPTNSNLLRVSLRAQGGIPFKCGGGLCGTCKCRIEAGLANTDEVKAKERKHLSEDDLRDGYRMACQTFVTGDVSVSWTRKPGQPALVPASA
jgi:ferredoxin